MSPSRAALLSNQVKGLMCWLVAYTMKIRSLSFGTRSKTQCTKSTGQGWKVLFLRKTLELQVFKKGATCGCYCRYMWSNAQEILISEQIRKQFHFFLLSSDAGRYFQGHRKVRTSCEAAGLGQRAWL